MIRASPPSRVSSTRHAGRGSLADCIRLPWAWTSDRPSLATIANGRDTSRPPGTRGAFTVTAAAPCEPGRDVQHGW